MYKRTTAIPPCSGHSHTQIVPSPSSHSAGDVLMVQPQNVSSAVDDFISLLHLNPDQQFVLEEGDPGEWGRGEGDPRLT